MISRSTRQQQKGVFSIIAGAALLVAIGVSALAIDLGHAYWVKRDLQKAADLASLSAVTADLTDLSKVQDVAERIALANGFNPEGTGNTWTVTTRCYDWNLHTPDPPCAGAPNAVQVTVSTPMKYYFWSFGGERTVQATAISAREGIAAFSLGSFLARVNTDESPLLAPVFNGLLGGLLGSSSGINLDIGSYKGLAAGSVKLGDLIAVPKLNVGTVQELLDANVKLADLLDATVTVLEKQGDTVAANILGNIEVPSTLNLTVGELLKVDTTNPEAAVDAKVNVLELLTLGAQVANGSHFVDIPNLGVDLGALASVHLGLSVIAPPTIAVGPARCVAGSCDKNSINDWMIKAHAAQVRLKLDVSLLGGVVNLPIYLEAGAADAALTYVQCASPRNAEILVQPQLLRALIGGGIDQAVMESNQPVLPPTPVDIVNLLGVIKITSKADVTLGGGASAAERVTIYEQSTPPPFPSYPETVASLGLGANLNSSLQANMVTAVVSLLGIPLIDAGPILEAILALLGPVLDGLLSPLLSMLGVSLGGADVTVLDVSCGAPQLVY